MEAPKLTEAHSLITGYGNGQFTIGGQKYTGSVLVQAGEVTAWPVSSVQELSLASLDSILRHAGELDVLLIGCGPHAAMIAPDIRQAFKVQGISIDAMDTGAACRTYNILLSEARRVAAALIAV